MTSADTSFDHLSADYARNWRATYADLRDRCPVARTEAHNGFYVLSRYADVERVVKDDATFSSRHDLENPESPYRGITIPEPPVRSVPSRWTRRSRRPIGTCSTRGSLPARRRGGCRSSGM